MIRLLLVLLLTALGAWFVADSMKQFGPGYVLVYYNHYSLETSVWVGLLLLFVAVLLCYILIRLFRRLLNLSWRGWRFRSSKQRQSFEQSVGAMLSENWLQAIRFAKRSNHFDDAVLAARAALAAKNIDKARSYAKKAATCENTILLTLLLLHFDIELADGNKEKVGDLLQQLFAENATHYAVLKRAVDHYCAENKISAANDLLATLLKKTAPLYLDLQKDCLVKVGVLLMRHYRQQNNQQALAALWQRLKKTSARNALIADYSLALITMEQEKEAEKLLSTRLAAQFDEACLLPYAMLSNIEAEKQLAYLQRMDTEHPYNAQVQLALGVVYLRTKQWQNAKAALEQSISIQPDAKAYYYLARYYESRGDERNAKLSLVHGLNASL